MRVTSFKMIDGRVRNLAGHFRRLGMDEAVQLQVRDQLRAAGPGTWFPLVHADGSVMLRPARDHRDLITVDPEPHMDLRRQPLVKGPDLPWLGERLRDSQHRGFDDGVLIDEADNLVEGIYSSLLVFTPAPTLSCHPRALESTTAQLAREFFGPSLREAVLTKAELVHPLWLLNAFSGARTTAASHPTWEFNEWCWARADEV